MVQAVIDLNDFVDRVVNVVKAKHGFKRKDEAVNFIVTEYAEDILEPELRPVYIEKATRINNEKAIKVGTVDQLRKRYE